MPSLPKMLHISFWLPCVYIGYDEMHYQPEGRKGQSVQEHYAVESWKKQNKPRGRQD